MDSYYASFSSSISSSLLATIDSRIRSTTPAPSGGGSGGGSHRIGPSNQQSESWGSAPVYTSNNRPLEVSAFYWAYAPLCVLCFFLTFLLLAKKLPRLHGGSLRHFLAHYINPEHMYTTLHGAEEAEVAEQRQLEIGHLCFELFGVVMLIFNAIINGDATRRPFLVLQYAQTILFFLHIVLDFVLLRFGYIHVVRGANSKLRFAHSSYQSLLFALDVGMTSGFGTSLPLDCFMYGITHYLYEAIFLILEGLNMFGSGDLVLIVAVSANAIKNEHLATGQIAAFGLSCLGLSCASFAASMCYKLISINLTKRRFLDTDDHADGHHDGQHGSPKHHSLSEREILLDDGDDDDDDDEKRNNKNIHGKRKSSSLEGSELKTVVGDDDDDDDNNDNVRDGKQLLHDHHRTTNEKDNGKKKATVIKIDEKNSKDETNAAAVAGNSNKPPLGKLGTFFRATILKRKMLQHQQTQEQLRK